tara:strand:+ start:392 stop:595 length:204 start_codon:yes stop_codon:yes gene_type:complete
VDAVKSLLEAQVSVEVEVEDVVELDPFSFLLQESRNKKRDVDRMRNNPTGLRKCFIKYFLFIVKLYI